MYKVYEAHDILPVNVFITVIKKSNSRKEGNSETLQANLTPEIPIIVYNEKDPMQSSRVIELKLEKPPFTFEMSDEQSWALLSLINEDFAGTNYKLNNWDEIKCRDIIFLAGILTKCYISLYNFNIDEKTAVSQVRYYL